jgi:hypothetical protein
LAPVEDLAAVRDLVDELDDFAEREADPVVGVLVWRGVISSGGLRLPDFEYLLPILCFLPDI